MGVTLKVKNVNKLVAALSGVATQVKMDITIRGPAAKYAMVWEWGRADIQPGPKTVWSTNPDEEFRVLTRQAPHGWIRVNKNEYTKFILGELRFAQLHKA